MERSLAAINQLYKEGAFKRFGLSNYLPHEVEQIVRICKENNYLLPSVFQGNYSPVARRADDELFPILRQHNIAFCAYSPIAGGFLTKTREILTGDQRKGRWDPSSGLGMLYGGLYIKPAYLDGLDTWGRIAEVEGISKAEQAYRWVAFSSKLRGELGDGIIFGTFNHDHIKDTVSWIRKGPLSANAAKKIDEMWETIRDESVWDNFNDYLEKHRADRNES
jgi:aflatoxin B1 aldehyde reductase